VDDLSIEVNFLNLPTLTIPRPSKISPYRDFWFENIPSGNPDTEVLADLRQRALRVASEMQAGLGLPCGAGLRERGLHQDRVQVGSLLPGAVQVQRHRQRLPK
jgi:hypothetical protein